MTRPASDPDDGTDEDLADAEQAVRDLSAQLADARKTLEYERERSARRAAALTAAVERDSEQASDGRRGVK